LQKIRQQARARAEERGARGLFEWASSVAEQPRTSSLRDRARHSLADRLVLKRVRRGLGGHLRVIVSGSAPLDPRLAAWFEGCGIAVREGWGLTETCAPATTGTLTEHRPGSVGRTLEGVEVRVAEDGELELRSPALFTGYLHDASATRAAFTPDGWFRTGDLGRIDADGFVWITGRKKDLIITTGGRNIAPRPIEAALTVDGIGQVVVLGDRRPFLVALFLPDPDEPGPEPRTAIEAAVEAWNIQSPRHHQVVRWAWSPTPLSIDSGTLTPTLKVQRAEVEQCYAALIHTLYED
jgi:long-chain acyl-CoA synthetase